MYLIVNYLFSRGELNSYIYVLREKLCDIKIEIAHILMQVVLKTLGFAQFNSNLFNLTNFYRELEKFNNSS